MSDLRVCLLRMRSISTSPYPFSRTSRYSLYHRELSLKEPLMCYRYGYSRSLVQNFFTMFSKNLSNIVNVLLHNLLYIHDSSNLISYSYNATCTYFYQQPLFYGIPSLFKVNNNHAWNIFNMHYPKYESSLLHP